MQKIRKWLENYWYHYKWTTIVVAFFVIVLGIGIFQMATKEEYDLDVLYTGPEMLTVEEKRDLANAFSSVMSKDFNEDGTKSVLINDITILSDEQIAEKEAEAKAESDSLYYDYSNREDAISRVSTLISTGETVICLMDEYMYEKYASQNAFQKLEDVLGEKPEYAIDDCAVYLSDTPFGKYFSACMALPADTILCVRKPSVISNGNKSKAEEHYDFAVETFRALFEFSVS